MTKKKVCQVPTESLSQANTEYTDYFLDQVGRDYTELHFFDESSVIVTTGNRVYGNSYIGEPAIEFQRYASKGLPKSRNPESGIRNKKKNENSLT